MGILNRKSLVLTVLGLILVLSVGCPPPESSTNENEPDDNDNAVVENDNAASNANDNGGGNDNVSNDNTGNDNVPSNTNAGNDNVDETIRQPQQAAEGPGGSDYSHQAVTRAEFGIGTEAYFLYEPANPTPASAPVIVFLHGFGGTNPQAYGGWISHLVRQGNTVIYPVYQTSLMGAEQYTANALAAVQDALNRLETTGHVPRQGGNFALAGHSIGGVIATNLAAMAEAEGLPTPRALLLANAADTDVAIAALPSILTDDLTTISSGILLLAVVGNDDTLARDEAAQTVVGGATQVSDANKDVVTLFSDDYGVPPVVAGHNACLALDSSFDSGGSGVPGETDEESSIDAIDFFGYWKFLDGLTDAAFRGINREFALGNKPQQTSLGTWSDGRSIQPAEIEPLTAVPFP